MNRVAETYKYPIIKQSEAFKKDMLASIHEWKFMDPAAIKQGFLFNHMTWY
jgi:hypothetical protein